MKRLLAENLVKRFGAKKAVDGVSLEVKTGEIVGLLGPNGAGKTTTFYMLVGLIPPTSGRVFLEERNITKMPMYQRARAGIGYLPQEASIFRRLTVEENILAVLEFQPISKRERLERTEELLERFGLTELRNQRGAALSGGERRRTEIARALSTRPSFILLDEPFTGIDPIMLAELRQIVAGLRSDGLGILVTDHNVRETLTITDRSYIIAEGKILTQGPSAQLPNDPIARKFYLGEAFEM